MVWRCFTHNRDTTRTPLSFQHATYTHKFPPRKPRNDYASYKPAGIMRVCGDVWSGGCSLCVCIHVCMHVCVLMYVCVYVLVGDCICVCSVCIVWGVCECLPDYASYKPAGVFGCVVMCWVWVDTWRWYVWVRVCAHVLVRHLETCWKPPNVCSLRYAGFPNPIMILWNAVWFI